MIAINDTIKKKVASLPILGLDSRSRFSDLSFHSQLGGPDWPYAWLSNPALLPGPPAITTSLSHLLALLFPKVLTGAMP